MVIQNFKIYKNSRFQKRKKYPSLLCWFDWPSSQDAIVLVRATIRLAGWLFAALLAVVVVIVVVVVVVVVVVEGDWRRRVGGVGGGGG